MKKTFALVLYAACSTAALASPEFSPEDWACQLPCESKTAEPTPVTPLRPAVLDKHDSATARQDAEQRVELRRLLAWAERPKPVR
jgi:hypothetical protein